MITRGGGRSGAWIAGLTAAILWVPLGVLVVQSFNASRAGGAWQGFTWDWYVAAAQNRSLLEALGNSLCLAVASTTISTVLGATLGYGLGRRITRHRWPALMVRLPTVVPDIVSAISLVLVFSMVGRMGVPWEPGMLQMIFGHVALQIPFVAMVVQARARALDPKLAEAARDLGATPVQVLWYVTLPLLKPGILAGALLALTLSLDDFAISFFNGGPGSTTLPVLIYASARRGISPEINAISTLLLLVTAGLALAVMRAQRRTGIPA